MTPLDELERLLELSKEGEFPSERYRAMKNFERLLGNHAEALIKVARAGEVLSKKMGEIHEDPQYLGVWSLAQNHMGEYRGPTYQHELKTVCAVLAAKEGK